MRLGDLIEELRDNILRDRSSQIDGPSDQLWSDKTLVRYINQAHRRFARRSLILQDSTTPECCTINLVAGVDTYTLHPSVLAVKSAKFQADRVDLARAGHSAFGTYHQPDAYFFDPAQLSSLPPGKVVAYSTDEQVALNDEGERSAVSLRVYPVPQQVYITSPFTMRVARLPLDDFTLEDLSARPEIPEDNQLEMLDWAAYLALRIVDHDAGNPARALEFKQSFEEHVIAARNDMKKKTFTPAQWGFGRNGWSYSGN